MNYLKQMVLICMANDYANSIFLLCDGVCAVVSSPPLPAPVPGAATIDGMICP